MRERVYWLDTLPKAEAQSQKEEGKRQKEESQRLPARADAVVIGAGYTGLSAARRLAKSGASVVVVERERVGFGASSRNGGQVLTGLRLDPSTLVSRYGEKRARELFESSLTALEHFEELIAAESIECEYERSGHIQAAWKPAHFEAMREEQALLARVFDHRVELVPRSEQRREIGSDRYHGLLLDERSAGINPARYVAGLAAAAGRAGARIVTGAGVERLQRGASEWTVKTTAGPIGARNVLVATNGYTGSFAPELRRRIIPIGSYVIATEPLGADRCAQLLPKRRMAYDSKNFLFYFRTTADHRLLFGGRASFTQPNTNTTRDAALILQRGIVTVFPELAGAGIDYAWGGQIALARDERPHAGRLDAGTFFAAAYAGHGIAMATMLGDVVARRMAGERVSHPFMDDRCPWIPLYNGTPWFLPLVGAYYQVMDWIS